YTIIPIHNEIFKYTDNICKYYLQSDFGQMYDRYISRKIMEQDKKLKNYDDTTAIVVIATIEISRDLYMFYLKYEIDQFLYNVDKESAAPYNKEIYLQKFREYMNK